MNATRQLHDLGQSLWFDNLTRALLTSGTLAFAKSWSDLMYRIASKSEVLTTAKRA